MKSIPLGGWRIVGTCITEEEHRGGILGQREGSLTEWWLLPELSPVDEDREKNQGRTSHRSQEKSNLQKSASASALTLLDISTGGWLWDALL